MNTRPDPTPTRPELSWVSHAWRYAVCLVISAAVWQGVAVTEARDHQLLFAAELVLGVLAYVLVFFRRRAPVRVALLIAAMSAFSGIAAGPATLAAVSVATLRRPWQVIVVGLANFAAAQFYTTTVAPFDIDSLTVTTLINLAVNAGMMGWGMYIGSRRELLWTLRARAERAENEQELRILKARSTERAQIAREMHDVLAHRITQVSMQAGAMAFRTDLDASRLREGLTAIQGQANDALHELRDVLGVLREDDAGTDTAHPQPTYADIAALVEQARHLGHDVTHLDSLSPTLQVPQATGRTLYRIIQEGITNARKHAPGAPLTIISSGDLESGITVVMSNPISFLPSDTPGSGLGLIGLRERTELRGGRLVHSKVGRSFVLEAWIPWAA